MRIHMGDKIEFTNVQLILFLSKFLEYSVGIAEKYGSLSNGGLEEARDFVVDEIKRRKREALEEK